MMTESEVMRLPTSVFRETVAGKVGELYSYLFQRLDTVLLIVLLIVLVVLFFKVRNKGLAKRARKHAPESTNEWFSWEEFEKWKGERKG